MIDPTQIVGSKDWCEQKRASTIAAYNSAIQTTQARINIRNQTLALPVSSGTVMSAAGFGAYSISQTTKNQLLRDNSADQLLISQYQDVISKAQGEYEVCVLEAGKKNANCAQKISDAQIMRDSEAVKMRTNALSLRTNATKLLIAKLNLVGAQGEILQTQIDQLQKMSASMMRQADSDQKRTVYVKGCSDPMSLRADSYTYS
jgi:hypothetical protein